VLSVTLLEGFVAGLFIATITAPAGVSGAVFLLPVQLDLLHVANPAVTPTNLLYNIISGPGALWRYRRAGQLTGPLTRTLLKGTLPGVAIGAVVRVHLVPGPRAFRLVAAAVLLSIGLWLIKRSLIQHQRSYADLTPAQTTGLAFVVGILGGIYGIGGGSIIGPILVGAGLAVTTVAPAALASTFVTSIVGALTYALLASTADGSIAPDWPVGIACGIGGLLGGYVGAHIQPQLPETALRLLLGSLAVAVGVMYLIQSGLP
jgi:uncharacterized membrane protein YfcA